MFRKTASVLALLALTFTGVTAINSTASAAAGSTSDATLSDLHLQTETGNGWYLTEGTRMWPNFSSDQNFYEAYTAFPGVLFYASPTDPSATIKVNGGDVTNQAMTAGAATPIHFEAHPNNLVTITVTAADGTTTKTYKVNVSSVEMAQPEILSFSPNKASTAGGEEGYAYVKHAMPDNMCSTRMYTQYSYIDSNGVSQVDNENVGASFGKPDADGISKAFFEYDPTWYAYRDATVKGNLKIYASCDISDPMLGTWRTAKAENIIPNAITYYNPTVTSVDAPATISQYTVIRVNGPGMNSEAYLNTYLLNPATGDQLWLNSTWVSNTTYSAYVYGNNDDEWRSAKTLKLVVEQYDDETGKPPVTLYSKDVKFTPEVPTQVAFSPAKGPLAGGNTVKVTGHHLCNYDRESWPTFAIGGVEVSNLSAIVCDNNSFWGSAGNQQFDQLDKFSFTVPAGVSAGPADITIDIGYGPTPISTKYIYGAKPTITSISPSTVANTGGSLVTLNGANFGLSGTPTVTIDGVKSPYVQRISDSKVIAMVPASSSTGAVELNIISSSGGGALDTPASLTLNAASANPTISSVTPGTAGVAGGDVVTISGTGFSANSTGVTFGGVPAKVTASTATSLTVEVPTADSAGSVSIVVGTPTGLATKPNGFTYAATPGVTSVSPSTISSTASAANSKVTITGVGFGSAGTIAVGSAKAVAYKSTLNGTTISGIAIPTTAVGTVSITITPTGAKVPFTTSVTVTGPTITYFGSDPYDVRFGETNPFTENGGWIPATTRASGGDPLLIQGSGFGTSGKVKIGSTLITPTSYTDTAITFNSPAIAAGSYDLTVVPASGVITAKKVGGLNVGAMYVATAITKIASSVNNTRSDPAYTFAPAVDSSDLFVITGVGFNSTDNGASTKVVIQSEVGGDPVTITPVSVSNTSVVFHAPRTLAVLKWASVKVVTKTEYALQQRGIFYIGVAPQPTVMNPGWGLCTKSSNGIYNPAVITATGDNVFGSAGTVSLGGTLLPAAAVSWSASAVTVDLSKQTSDLANPWGVKPIIFTPADSSLTPQTWSFNCSVQTNVTTKLNGSSADLSIAAGTSYTASSALNNPLTGTTFVAADSGYYYQSSVDHANNARVTNVRSGLPVAAGDWYVWVNIGAATWDRTKYNQVTTANDVHLTLTGTPVSFTPKLTAGADTSIVYRGQLGDGTAGTPADISYNKTATADAVTEVTWQYRNHQCAVHDSNTGWSNGLPSKVAISTAACGGDDTTVTSWDIRVASFKMVSGGVDKSIYYLPTYNTFNLTITKKSLTISAVKAEKIYDGTTSVTLGDITVNGAVDGDTVTLDPTFAAGASFANADAGSSKPITLSGPFALSSYWAGNYTLANPNLTVLGNIKKADAVLKLDASPTSVVMGNTSSVALTVTTTDARGQSQISAANAPAPVLVDKSTSICSLNGTTVTPIKAGDCVIQATQASSTDYNAAISYHDDSTTVETITIKIYAAPKVVSVVADDIQVAAGDTISPTYSMTGLLDGDSYDNVTFAYYQGTTLLNAAPTTVGTYKIVPSAGSLTAVDSAAYNSTVKYVPGKLVITAAPPVITATSPAHGPEAGGNNIVITGTGFNNVTSITFGDLTLRKPKFVVNGTGTTISFKIPKGSGGVTVTLNAGSAQVSTDYTYDAPPVVVTPTAPLSLKLKLNLVIGAKFAGQSVEIKGGGLKANSEYILTMHSNPLVIYKANADANGNFLQTITIPAKACLTAGVHNLALTGISPTDKPLSDTAYFVLDDQCRVGAEAIKTSSKSWTLNGFLFGYTQPELNAGGIASLKALSAFIKGAKTVEVLGYTETDTKSAAIKKSNIVLAQGRCDSVVAYLKSQGIKAKYTTVAKGGVDPVSLSDQSKNRRVVINATY